MLHRTIWALAAGLWLSTGAAAFAAERSPQTKSLLIATQSYVYSSLALAEGFKAVATLEVSSDDRVLIFHIHHADREIQAARRELSRLRASDASLAHLEDAQKVDDDLAQAHHLNQRIVQSIASLSDVRALAEEQARAIDGAYRALLRFTAATGLSGLPPPGYSAYESGQGRE